VQRRKVASADKSDEEQGQHEGHRGSVGTHRGLRAQHGLRDTGEKTAKRGSGERPQPTEDCRGNRGYHQESQEYRVEGDEIGEQQSSDSGKQPGNQPCDRIDSDNRDAEQAA
jgi:hypothetical protein